MSPLDRYLREGLRARSLADCEFDHLYPADVRLVSQRFWTPLTVAWRAAEWLAALNATRVLDVGSGPGKFCIAAAARTPHIEFMGVEQRPHLVDAAEDGSRRMRTQNVRFAVGDATRIRLHQFDALYLFNPFGENAFDEHEWFDSTVELSSERYARDLRRIRSALAATRLGTLVLTYHGYGARPPREYDCVNVEPIGSDRLCIWRKVRDVVPGTPRVVAATGEG